MQRPRQHIPPDNETGNTERHVTFKVIWEPFRRRRGLLGRTAAPKKTL